jgi:hypothetical protein
VVERASRTGVEEKVEWEAGATMGSDGGGWPVTAMPLTSWSSPPRSGVGRGRMWRLRRVESRMTCCRRGLDGERVADAGGGERCAAVCRGLDGGCVANTSGEDSVCKRELDSCDN